jgi:hypothetical protein
MISLATPMKEKSNVLSITIQVVEGKGDKPELTFSTFAETDSTLDTYRIPGDIHTDKVKFNVVWDDAEKSTWEGTYMLDHGKEAQSLGGHIKYYCEHSAGLIRPDGYSDVNWENHLLVIKDYKDEYIEWLANFKTTD